MRIAILGTGNMGRTLGGSLAKSGHDIVFGSRNPDSAADLPGPVRDHAGAIEGSEVVISALAAARSLETLIPLRNSLAGRVLIDIGNAVDQNFNLLYPNSSLGERLQQALPETRVVKTLNTFGGPIGVDPTLLAGPTNVFLSGDDAAAKATVAGLLTELGWGPDQQIDLGGIATAKGPEHYFQLFATLLRALGTGMFNIAVIKER